MRAMSVVLLQPNQQRFDAEVENFAQDEIFDGLDEVLDVAIFSRHSGRDALHVEAGISQHDVELRCEDGVPIHAD